MTEATPRPVVIGGGIAGVVTALYLAEAGLRPILLEQHPTRLGGRWRGGSDDEALTMDHAGRSWRFESEHGMHGLWGQYHNLRATLIRFLGPNALDDLLPAEHQEWIYGDRASRRAQRIELGHVVTHTLVPAPFHYLALFFRPSFLSVMTIWEIASLPWIFASLQLALVFDPLVKPRDAEFLSRIRLRSFFFGWAPRLRTMVAAVGRSGLFADPDVAPLGGFVAFLRFYTLLRRDSQRFQYLTRDPQQAVFAPLAEAITRLGGDIHLSASVRRLDRHGEDAWQVTWEDTDGHHTTNPSPIVVATDAPATQRLLLSSDQTRRVAEAHVDWPAGLPNAAIRLWWDREPDHRYAEAGIFGGDFTGDNVFWLNRIMVDSTFGEWGVVTGGSACEVHVYGPDDVLDLPDATLISRIALDVRRAYPDLRKAQLLASVVRRNPPTHTLFNVGSTSRHLEVESPWTGLWLAGDWVRYPSPTLFLERATVTSMAAAAGLIKRRGGDPPAIQPVKTPELLARAFGAVWRLFVRHLT